MRKRQVIRALADIYEEATGRRPTIIVSMEEKRGGSWYLFATSLTTATWGETSGGIVRAITEERTEFPYSVPSID